MIFRRHEKRPAQFSFARILVPLRGSDVDADALGLTSLLLGGAEGEASLLHVIEVPFDRQLDAQDEAAVARADQILERAESFLAEHGVRARTSVVQARAAGPAIVDDANELGAELIVMGLPYKMRFGGQWDAGRTVPYVMRNSTAPVWCLRHQTKELAHTP
ncbi:MAG TPA: universal stress protein [Candidatus Limnocylindria bacterium]|nr:universal stress protein [Candidatus Limnocylindria bacterium]